MVIIPLVLDENIAKQLPQEYINTMASCSTDIVVSMIKKYLDSNEANKEVLSKIELAYSPLLGRKQFLSSEELQEDVKLVGTLNYTDINPILSIEELEAYKAAIIRIITNENSIPYIAPIKGDIISGLVDAIKEHAIDTDNKELKNFADKLKKYGKYFRNSQHESYKGTPVKKIMRNKTEYEILLKGIDFILDKKRKNLSPRAWRYM